MALDRVDWPPEDPRWWGMLLRPTWNNGHRLECCDTLRLILARSGPHHRDPEYGRTILHEVIPGDPAVGVRLATILLDAGARLDVRDKLLMSTPLGWACRWGYSELVKLFLARGADPVEADAEPWATPRAWAERMGRTEIVEVLDSLRARPT
jgi:ankyrin repeat protein